MAYDEALAQRMRKALASKNAVTEKRMMGGVCFFINGNMIGGADRSKIGAGRFMFRVGRDNADEAAKLGAHAAMEQGGRIMAGFYFVAEEECDDDQLANWLKLAVSYAKSLPPK